KWAREEEIIFAKENGVPVPADLDSPYSVDQNLWGRANECGVLENPWNEAPEDAFGITSLTGVGLAYLGAIGVTLVYALVFTKIAAKKFKNLEF
ncbi:hypothetical protein ACVZHU_21150, partial [Clostridioides difficile]